MSPVAGEDVLKVNTAHWTEHCQPATLYPGEQAGSRLELELEGTFTSHSGVQAVHHCPGLRSEISSTHIGFQWERNVQFSTFPVLSLSQTNKTQAGIGFRREKCNYQD